MLFKSRTFVTKIMLQAQMKESMKSKEKLRVNVIKSVLSDILNAEKSGLAQVPSVTQIIQRAVKKRRDAVREYISGGRKDLADNESNEIDILSTFLPKQLTRDEIKQIVEQVVEVEGLTSQKQLGKLMKILNEMEELDVAIAPRKIISEVAVETLNQ